MCESDRNVDWDTLERYARLGRQIASYGSVDAAKHDLAIWLILATAMAISAFFFAAGALFGAALMTFISW